MTEADVSDLLLYQTSDPKFADRAVEALREAGISCYRVGTGAERLHMVIGRWTDSLITIYATGKVDPRRASQVLIELGAVVEQPFRLPNRWLIALIAAVLVVLIFVSVSR